MTATAPALGLSVTNAAGQTVTVIGDGLPVNVLTMRLTNSSGAPIVLRGGVPAPDTKPDPAAASGVSLYFGTLLTADAYGALVLTAPGWTARRLGPNRTWTLAPAADVTLAVNASVVVTISGMNVAGPARPGNLTVAWANVGSIANGYQQLPLACQAAPPSGTSALPLSLTVVDPTPITVTTDPATPVANTIVLRVANTSLSTIGATWDPAAPPVFYLSFVYGTPQDGFFALTSAQLAGQISVTVSAEGTNQWVAPPTPVGENPVWVIHPVVAPVLGTQGASIVELTVGNIVSPVPPGTTQAYLQWAGIPGYADGVATAFIDKIAPVQISELVCDPPWTPEGVAAQPTLRWTTTGVPTSIEVQGPQGNFTVREGETSFTYPVALSHTTRLTLHVEGQGQPVDGHVTFEALTFPSHYSTPFPGYPTQDPFKVLRSPRWGVAYAGCFENLLSAAGGQVIVFDASAGTQLAMVDASWSAKCTTNNMWMSPPVVDGVDRLAVASNLAIQVWDFAADHTGTRRATLPEVDPSGMSTRCFGFAASGDLLVGQLDGDLSNDVLPTKFSLFKQDPLGVKAASPVQVFPLPQLTVAFLLTPDQQFLIELAFTGPVRSGTDHNDPEEIAEVVLRKIRIADGVQIEEVSLGNWYLGVYLLAVGMGVMPQFAFSTDGALYLFFRDGAADLGPDPLPFATDGPQLVRVPFDGSSSLKSWTLPAAVAVGTGNLAASLAGQQFSPNGIDYFIPSKGGLWVAPLHNPEVGTMLAVSEPGVIEFSPDGTQLILPVMDPNNQLAYSLVGLTRTVVPTVSAK